MINGVKQLENSNSFRQIEMKPFHFYKWSNNDVLQSINCK